MEPQRSFPSTQSPTQNPFASGLELDQNEEWRRTARANQQVRPTFEHARGAARAAVPRPAPATLVVKTEITSSDELRGFLLFGAAAGIAAACFGYGQFALACLAVTAIGWVKCRMFAWANEQGGLLLGVTLVGWWAGALGSVVGGLAFA